MENADNLKKFLADIWLEIANFAHESAVYIDKEAMECLHWYTAGKGYSFFKDAGAIVVCDLNSRDRDFEVKNCQKALIISTFYRLYYDYSMEHINEKNAFEEYMIVTCARNTSIQDKDYQDNYAKLKKDVKHWVSSKHQSLDCSVTVLFRPIFISLIDNNLFVTPTFWDLFPPFIIGNKFSYEINQFVSLFDGLFEHLNLRKDIYALGKFSESFAEQFKTSLYNTSELCDEDCEGVSLILVDRTLDLCTPTSRNVGSLLSRILCTLPRFVPENHNDVAVDMSPLVNSEDPMPFNHLPGCLASSDKNLINMLITQKQNDVLSTLNDMVNNALQEKKKHVKSKITNRVSVHSLKMLINDLKELQDPDIIMKLSKDLQITLAVLQALTSEKSTQLELLINLENLILENVATSREYTNVFNQFTNIIETRKERNLDMGDIFILLIHIYAFVGTKFAPQQEYKLTEAISIALAEDIVQVKNQERNRTMYQTALSKTGYYVEYQSGMCEGYPYIDIEDSIEMVEKIMETLHKIAEQRAFLPDYASLISKSNSKIQRCGILQQLLMNILSSEKNKSSALHQESPGFAGFKGEKKRHPCDNDWIIFYVIGGITPEEVNQLNEIALSHKTKCRITIGSTKLITPEDILKYTIFDALE